MSLELQLRDAKLKPDEILKRIAEKFGFSLGIPLHAFKGKWMETKQEFYRKDWKSTAKGSLFVSEYLGFPAFKYVYIGPILREKAVQIVCYKASLIPDFRGCRGGCQEWMTVSEDDTPDWFPGICDKSKNH